jgi:hypothetical protein
VKGFKLCQFFDYIGGTSTGAIIAAALACGLRVPRILDFYEAFGKAIFTRRRWGVWHSLYDHGPLEKQLKKVYGEARTLEPGQLETLLLVVVRNASTDSVWPLSSNPFAKYNDPNQPNCNLKIPLWKLVRASTAAPVFFPAEVIDLDANDPTQSFVFVDGGTSSYNNPAFLLTRMATEPRYALGWARGEGNLLVVSIGTGESAVIGAQAEDPSMNLGTAGANTLFSLMSQAAYDQDVNCRTVGRCTFGDLVDDEVGDLIPLKGSKPIPLTEDLGRGFLYARYNASLSEKWLKQRGLGRIDVKKVRSLAAAAAMNDLRQIGKSVGEDVSLAHFGAFTEQPLFVNGRFG